MNHDMKLDSKPYEAIESGMKTIELRLNDVKRQQVMLGDTITFTHTKNSEKKLRVRVTARHEYVSFFELFAHVPIAACGFNGDLTAEEAVLEIRNYYSAEREAKYGALGIEFTLIS